MKEKLYAAVEARREALAAMSDYIFDNPELGLQEFKAEKTITDYLERNGFQVEHGIAGLATAFRAVYQNGEGGPRIGLLCEYDALKDLGHGCGHHLQGPCMIGAAVALKECVKDRPFTVVVYGTPAEETEHGKVTMQEHGCFRDIDVALMMHANPTTTVDVKAMALTSYTVTFHGKEAHAALKPDAGRSAFDAFLVTCQGVEFMREHVPEDTRIHYTILQSPGPANVVHGTAVGHFMLRSYSREALDKVTAWFRRIVRGAALIADVTYAIEEGEHLPNKVPVLSLNRLLMENAERVKAPNISPPRQKTGSTDFSSVMYQVPGSCIRMGMVAPGTASHSQEYLDAGKSKEAHDAVILGAEILAASSWDMISRPEVMAEIQEEFKKNRLTNQ